VNRERRVLRESWKVLGIFAAACWAISLQGALAQTPAPVERVTFDEAIRRAVEKNLSAAIAAAGILRAEGLLLDARSASRLQINGTVSTTTLNTSVEFQGVTVTPRNSLTASSLATTRKGTPFLSRTNRFLVWPPGTAPRSVRPSSTVKTAGCVTVWSGMPRLSR